MDVFATEYLGHKVPSFPEYVCGNVQSLKKSKDTFSKMLGDGDQTMVGEYSRGPQMNELSIKASQTPLRDCLTFSMDYNLLFQTIFASCFFYKSSLNIYSFALHDKMWSSNVRVKWNLLLARAELAHTHPSHEDQ